MTATYQELAARYDLLSLCRRYLRYVPSLTFAATSGPLHLWNLSACTCTCYHRGSHYAHHVAFRTASWPSATASRVLNGLYQCCAEGVENHGKSCRCTWSGSRVICQWTLTVDLTTWRNPRWPGFASCPSYFVVPSGPAIVCAVLPFFVVQEMLQDP